MFLNFAMVTGLLCTAQVEVKAQGFDFELSNFNFNKEASSVNGTIAKGDVDNDGDVDVFISTRYPKSEGFIYLNDGKGNFTVNTNNVFPGSDLSYSEFIDIDKDGDLDLMFMGRVGDGGQTNLYLNDGSGNFTLKQNLGITNCHSGEFSLGDIDNDNDLDIVICGIEGSLSGNHITITKVFANNGFQEFTALTSSSIENLHESSVKLVDLDNDKDLDIVIMGESKINLTRVSKIKTYLNIGSGVYTELSNPNLIPTTFSAMSLADSDGDGDVDLLVSGNVTDVNISDSTRLYTNNGNGVFVETARFPYSLVGSVHFADFDEDGDQDIFFDGVSSNICCPHNNRTINIYKNIGGNNFIESFSQNNPPVYNKSVIADFNGDSKLDFITMGDGITNNDKSTQMFFSKSNVTGIQNSFAASEVTVFPNPANNQIQIKLDNLNPINLEVFNNLGVLVAQFTDANTILNIENYNQGMYSVKIQDENGVYYVTKFIKN